MATKPPIILDGTGAGQKHAPLGTGDTLPSDAIQWCDALSPDADNLLECVNGKISFRQIAPPDTANLYVDTAAGDDTAAGTRAAPLKTLHEALARQTNKPVLYTVWLKAGQTFVIDTAFARALASYNFRVYDDPVYGDQSSWQPCASYWPWLADDYSRPTIKSVPYQISTGEWVWSFLSADNIALFGMNMEADLNGVASWRGNPWILACNYLRVEGSTIHMSSTGQSVCLASVTTAQLRNVEINAGDTYGMFSTFSTIPSVGNRIIGGNGSQDGCNVNPPYANVLESNFMEPGMLGNVIHNPAWDANSGMMFNFHVNWDPRQTVSQVTPGFTFTTNNLVASFTDTSSSDNGNINTWSWHFGDGGSDTTQNPSHTYAAAGTYGVTLTVKDDLGSGSTATASVTVQASGSGGGGGSGPIGGGGCVVIDNVVEGGGEVGKVRKGDTLQLGDEKTLEPATGEVHFQRITIQPCVRITTANGAVLECSTTAPLPTKERGLLRAPLVKGFSVGTKLKDKDPEWSAVVKVESIGRKVVNHLGVDNKCFWAGKDGDALILHHNMAEKV